MLWSNRRGWAKIVPELSPRTHHDHDMVAAPETGRRHDCTVVSNESILVDYIEHSITSKHITGGVDGIEPSPLANFLAQLDRKVPEYN